MQTSPLEDLGPQLEPLAEEQADSHLLDEETRHLLDEGVKQLTPQRRMVFTLKRKKNLSNKEIARHLNLSVKTVENHMTATITFLRNYVNLKTNLIVILIGSFKILFPGQLS